MLPPQTYTIVHEGVEAKFWVVTFAEQVFTYEEGVKMIVKYGIYSYN
jgi:hypothetical protein